MVLVFNSCLIDANIFGGRRGLSSKSEKSEKSEKSKKSEKSEKTKKSDKAVAADGPAPADADGATPAAGAAAAGPTATAAGPTAAAAGGATTAGGAAAAAGGATAAGGAAAAGGGTVFDITKYGAVPDGATQCSKAFIKAWVDVCASTAPATLLIPKGNFLTGPVIFAGPCKSKITIEVVGTVIATATGFASPEWILFERVDDLIVTGGGTFDGKGEAVWKADGCGQKSNCNLPPTSLKFRRNKNVDVNNIVSLNAKAFHMFLVKTEKFTIQKVKLIAPAESPNTDGIHLSNTVDTSILASTIATGDDCVSIGRGSINTIVEGVVCGPGHGISIGSLGKYKNEEDVTGVHVKNCTLKETDNGARIKTWGGSGPSKATDIQFENIIMENVKNPIIIDQFYGTRGGDSQVAVSNVLFKNIKGTSATKDVLQLVCSKSTPCTGVNVEDVTLNVVGKGLCGSAVRKSDAVDAKKKESSTTVDSYCSNAKVVIGGAHNFPLCQAA